MELGLESVEDGCGCSPFREAGRDMKGSEAVGSSVPMRPLEGGGCDTPALVEVLDAVDGGD